MPKSPKILFVCTGNSARSQMAEGFARYYGGHHIVAESAGISPKGVNPYASWVMNEAGVDIQFQSSDDIAAKRLENFDMIVTLCGHAKDSCPTLPSGVSSDHWPLSDPAAFRGKVSEVREAFRLSRNEIERRVKKLLNEMIER